jgi:hypothetical protein
MDYGLPKHSILTKTITKAYRKGFTGYAIAGIEENFVFFSLYSWGKTERNSLSNRNAERIRKNNNQ